MPKYQKTDGISEHLDFEPLAVTHNQFRYKGVDYAGHASARRGIRRFRARVGSGKNRINGPWVETAEQAARIYDNMARKRYGLRARLNFPEAGEKGVKPGRTMTHCRHGHPFAEFGHIDAKTGWLYCARCNLIRVNTANWGRSSFGEAC